MMFIYSLINKVNNEVIYIGKTKKIKRRINEHKRKCFYEKDKGYNREIYKYIRENNIDFDLKIIEGCYENESNSREFHYIKIYKDTIYNICRPSCPEWKFINTRGNFIKDNADRCYKERL